MIQNSKFSVLQITYWCSYGAFAAFMASYMTSKGMSATLLGVMLTANTFGGFCGQFVFSGLCDKLNSHKKIFMLASFMLLLIELLIFSFDNTMFIIVAFAFLGFVQQPLVANLDTWIIKKNLKNPNAYGFIRSMASISFALFMFFFGTFLQKNGYIYMLIFSAIFILISILVAWGTDDAISINSSERTKISIKELTTNKSFVLLLILLLGAGVASAPILQFMVVIMKRLGGGLMYVGYASFASAIMQTPIIFLTGKLRRFTPQSRILFGAVLYILSLSGIALSLSLTIVLVFCAVNGCGFGLILPALREYVFKIVPKQIVTTAQGACDAVYNCLGMMCGNIIGGVLIDSVGIPIMLITCSAILAICVMIFSFVKVRSYKV